jgi:hypothetical protein
MRRRRFCTGLNGKSVLQVRVFGEDLVNARERGEQAKEEENDVEEL